MKIRKFYPSQVLRRQAGKRLSHLDVASRHAFNIALRRSRKRGVVVTVVDDQIDVRTAAEMGQMVLGDIRTVQGQDALQVVVSRLTVRACDLGISITPSQIGS